MPRPSTVLQDADPDLLVRYVRLLRFAWLNPSCAEAQAAMHAFERVNDKMVKSFHDAATEPLLHAEELAWALQNLNYFATAAPGRWARTTKTDKEVRELLGGERCDDE